MPTEAETTRIPPTAVDLVGMLDGYGATQISGLTRPKATINRSKLAGANASRISGAQIAERNIVITVVPQDDGEALRQELYNILPFDTMLRFYIETEHRQVFIDGYVEDLGGDADEPNGEEFAPQISILCPFPWFQSVKLHKMKLSVGENKISYDGDIPAGFTLDVPQQITPPLIGSVSDLSVSVGGKTFAYSGRIAVPHICTIPGKKQFYGIRKDAGNALAPAFGAMVSGCKWPTISKSDKIVTISCAEADVEWFEQQNVFTYRDTYSGV